MTSRIIVILLIWFINPNLQAMPTPTNQVSVEILTYKTEILSLETVPIIKATLNGQIAYFILDSGSDVSLLHNADAVHYGFSCHKTASKYIVGAYGGDQRLYGVATVDLQIDQRELHTTYFATDLTLVVESLYNSTGITISGIIGVDIMSKYGFEIDYSNKRLLIHL